LAASFSLALSNPKGLPYRFVSVFSEQTFVSQIESKDDENRAGLVARIRDLQVRFIADSMLGRLAKWMRAIGCDVTYYPRIEDGELVDRASREGRIILTKDILLVKRRKAKGNSLLVVGNSYRDQLRQVVEHFSIDPYQGFLTRCIECNIPLADIEKEMVKEKVPEYVYQTQDSFSLCPACQRIYWGATHKDEMLKMLGEIFIK
jgi:uncharacterized protein with PIN domain